MSKTPNFDAKIKALLDATTPGERVCPISGEKWMLTAEDIERYRGWNVPPPAYGPAIRLKLLSSGIAGVDLWWKPHALTGKPILSSGDPDSIHPVVPDEEWYAMDDGAAHGQPINLTVPFFTQMESLMRETPVQALYSHSAVNVVGGGFRESTNCFMIFGTFFTKDSFYCVRSQYLDRCMDCVFLTQASESFSCAMGVRLHRCLEVLHSIDCLYSAFLFECRNCEFCFCSSNLRNQKYVFENEQLSKEEYESRLSQIDLSRRSVYEHWRERFRQHVGKEAIWPEHFNINSEGSSGEYLRDCVDCDGWYLRESRDLKSVWMATKPVEHAESVVVAEQAQDVYETAVAFNAQNVKFCFVAIHSRNLEYCNNCRECEDCFGCHGLRNRRFYIFNRPYAEDEYYRRVDELKCAMLDSGEYGQFWPWRLHIWRPQFGFASIVAPFTEGELKNLQVPPFDPEKAMRYAPYKIDTQRRSPAEAPEAISEEGQEWANVVFDDPEQRRPFSLNQTELNFRLEHGYPFPSRHYRGRLLELVRQVNGTDREERNCAHCHKKIIINRNSLFVDRSVYCMTCYLAYLESR